MFNLNRTSIAFCLLLIGTCSSVFAVDISQAIDQMKTDVFSMWDLFEGKPVVSNIYSKALKLAKDKEISSTTTSFDYLKTYYNECSHIENIDFINVLYNSNASFKQTFDQILPEWTKTPTSKQINQSYAKFFACKNILVAATVDQIASLNNEINKVYYDGYSNAYALSTLNEDNFWSDLLWNGTLDDSSFDLLYDINQIGKILFENFKESPEVLFYRLPVAQSSSTQNGSDLSSLSDQSSYQLWGGWGSFPGTTWVPIWTTPSAWWSSSPNDSSSSIIAQTQKTISPTDDEEIQAFIDKTNKVDSPSSIAGAALVFWNQCLSSDTAVIKEEQPVLETPEAYISGLQKFIDTASINDVLDAELLKKFHDKTVLPPWWNTSDPGYAEHVANSYAEQAFGEAAPWTCEYSCNGLPLDQQVKCELQCSKSCIQTCDALPLQDKLLCVSDCTCFLIAWPNGAGWAKIEDMFRIKFCKVPVETKTVVPWKKVFSIQAIFQEISDVLEWLRDSGQMVKFSKTKEFLDGNIKIKFADNFAFKLQVGFKPVFAQKSATIKTQEEIQANMDLDLGVLDMNTSAPEADDYNKYIIISDPIKNKATLEQATSLSDVDANIANFAAAATTSTRISNEMIESIQKTYVQWSNIWFVQNMIDFLTDNQLFWENLRVALFDMNKMSLELETKIENSK